MGKPDLSVDTELLRDIGKEIKKYGENYTADAKKLYSEVEKVKDSWEGDDGDEYYNGTKSYEADILALGQTIENIGVYLINTANGHETRVASLKSSAKKLFSHEL